MNPRQARQKPLIFLFLPTRLAARVLEPAMNIQPTSLDGVLLIEPKVFCDPRGFFLELYNRERYRQHGMAIEFVQDNRAFSLRGVLRGLHFQIRHPQTKLVWVPRGEVFDVALDLRQDSPTFGKWEGFRLTDENHRQLYIPAGFAHAYCVLSETAEFVYKCSDTYRPGDEGGVIWNDPDLGIDWPIETPVLSEKDLKLPRFRDLAHYF